MAFTATSDPTAKARTQKQALEFAVRDMLDAAAFKARKRLLEALGSKVDKASRYTLLPSGYRTARTQRDGDSYYSQMWVMPGQAEYLAPYIFTDHSLRRPGDPGSTGKWIWLPEQGNSRTPQGGLRKGFVARVAEDPGVWFGTVNGRPEPEGMWKRPKRTKAKTRTVKGKTMLLRPHDPSKQVHDKGGPLLLAEARKETAHHMVVDHAAIMEAEYANALSGFGTRFTLALGR